MKHTWKKPAAFALAATLLIGASPSIPMTATAAASDARFIMDAEALSDHEIAVLFVEGGTSSNGVTTGGTLCYGVYDTSTSAWAEQTVGATSVAASEAALDIYEGAPHVAYVNTDGDIAYTYLEAAGWSNVSIITSNDCNAKEGKLSRPDLEVNSSGKAYVSYMDTQGADDDYYSNSEVMIANNSTGEFVNSVVVNGTGWFSSPDGEREYASSPKLTLIDSGYAVVVDYYHWDKWMGGSDKWYSAAIYSASGNKEYHEGNSDYTILETVSDGTDVYSLIYYGGYKIIKYADSGASLVATATDIPYYSGDMTIDDDKLYFTAASGSKVLFYIDGTKETFDATTAINTNHNKAASVVVDGTPYILYTGSDDDYSLVITKYDGTNFEEYKIPRDPTPAEVFLAQVADSTTSTITLTEDIDVTGSLLDVSKDLAIDLNGNTLTVNGIINVEKDSSAVTLTINDTAGGGSITGIDDLMAYNDEKIVINGGSFVFSGADEDIFAGSNGTNFVLNGGTFNLAALTWKDDWNAYIPATSKKLDNGNGSYTIINTKLADGQYKQTAQKDENYYTRFVFVVPKIDFAGKSNAKFTATHNSIPYTYETSKYYTGMTTNGITYTPASDDSAIFVVTISSGSDISDELTCTLDFE
ncbi:hypothetical protein [Ruminococcus sp.]|uniref:hypothetical protein n=1 Tax=Ruminococcus sp. TaxID=41978 RepID=UPI0025E0E5AF|nr:hypothetical protein [Ruminococcus sp.]